MAHSKSQPKVPFNVRLDPAIYNALCARSGSDGVTKTDIVDSALRTFLRLAARKEK